MKKTILPAASLLFLLAAGEVTATDNHYMDDIKTCANVAFQSMLLHLDPPIIAPTTVDLGREILNGSDGKDSGVNVFVKVPEGQCQATITEGDAVAAPVSCRKTSDDPKGNVEWAGGILELVTPRIDLCRDVLNKDRAGDNPLVFKRGKAGLRKLFADVTSIVDVLINHFSGTLSGKCYAFEGKKGEVRADRCVDGTNNPPAWESKTYKVIL